MHSKNPLKPIHYLILLGFILFSFYYGFASFPIEDMNEGLYAEIAREMLVMHNYIIPHLNFLPYLEKPPLLYWLIAVNYHIFGVSSFAARLVAVTAAAIICVACVVFGRAISKARAGWIAGLILASSVGFILVARVILFDMLLTCFFTLGLMCFYLWYQSEKRYFIWLSYILLALAFMTKRMVAVMLAFFIVVVFMVIATTPWKKLVRLFDPVGMGLFLLLIIPWVLAATLQQPGFAWDFFVNEQILRFLNKRIPNDYHHGPFYYYLPRIFVYLFPWILLVPLLFKRKQEKVSDSKLLVKYLWLWFLIPLLFFSVSQAKGNYYMILGMPPLAFLLGIKLDEYLAADKFKWLFGTFISVSLLLAAVSIAPLKISALTLEPNLMWPLPWISGFTICMLIAGCILHFMWRRAVIMLVLIGSLVIPITSFYVFTKQQDQIYRSQAALARTMLKQHPEWPIYYYQDYENFSSMTFYLQKRAVLVDSHSQDLYFGLHTPQAQGWNLTLPEFLMQAQSVPLYVVLLTGKVSLFEQNSGTLKFCKVVQNEKVTVLTPCIFMH